MPLSLDIFLVFVSLIGYAIFSMAETSILTVRKTSIKKLSEDEDELPKTRSHAKAILEIKSHPEEFLAFVQSGTILSAVIAATFASFVAVDTVTGAIASLFHTGEATSAVISFIITILVLAPLLLTFGGLIPKSIALHQNTKYSLLFAPSILTLMRITKPITKLPVIFANIFLKPFKDSASFTESRISEEEFLVMLEEGTRSGIIDKTENELIENIFDFREKTVREVMIHRTKVVGINIDTPREELIKEIVAQGYTRLPVYQDSLDTIVGVVYSKDVLALIEHPDLIILYDILRPVTFIPETKLIAELLRDFQHKKLHLAVVIDEFGGTAGIVTLEDIIEEIVGEIHDEYDEELLPVINDAPNRSMTLSANLTVEDANSYLEQAFSGLHIPDGDEYDSVGGYVTKLFGHIPETSETAETEGMKFTVLKRTPKEVIQVLVEDRRPITE